MKKCEGIYSLIGKVNHKSAIYGFELLKEENIHPRQMPLIIHLKKCEGCTQKELAEKMQVKPSTLNVMIGRMEKNGYIEKKQDEKDSRKSRIYFTEKGRSICEDGHKKFVMIQEKLQEYFTKEEQEEKQGVMEERLLAASLVPLQMMEKTSAVLDILGLLEEKGSKMAVSDVGVAAQMARAALNGAVTVSYTHLTLPTICSV